MDLPAHDLPGNRDGAPLEPTFAIHPDYLYGDAAQGAGRVNQINAEAAHFAPRRLGQSTQDATSTSALKLRCHVVKQRS